MVAVGSLLAGLGPVPAIVAVGAGVGSVKSFDAIWRLASYASEAFE